MESETKTSLYKLIDEFHDWRLKEFPEYATIADVHIYNNKLGTLSLAKFDERKSKCEHFLALLDNIKRDTLEKVDRAHFDLLKDFLKTYIEGHKWRYFSACNPVTFLENIHLNFKSFLIDATPFETKEDFYNYAERLHCIPTQIDEQVTLMKEAIYHKTTLHRVSVENVPGELAEIIEEDIPQHPFYEPCRQHIEKVPGNP